VSNSEYLFDPRETLSVHAAPKAKGERERRESKEQDQPLPQNKTPPLERLNGAIPHDIRPSNSAPTNDDILVDRNLSGPAGAAHLVVLVRVVFEVYARWAEWVRGRDGYLARSRSRAVDGVPVGWGRGAVAGCGLVGWGCWRGGTGCGLVFFAVAVYCAVVVVVFGGIVSDAVIATATATATANAVAAAAGCGSVTVQSCRLRRLLHP